MPGLFIGQLFDRGHLRVPLAVSSIMLVVCTLLVAQCKVYWQFLLCQGFAVGVRLLLACRPTAPLTPHPLQLFSGLTFGPLVAVIAHWFKRRKGLALGFLAFGSSTGGTVFPVAVHKLIPEVGCALPLCGVLFAR